MKVVLRPAGRGNWRPLVLTVDKFPRKQGLLFRRDDADLELVKKGQTWMIDGHAWRVSEVRP